MKNKISAQNLECKVWDQDTFKKFAETENIPPASSKDIEKDKPDFLGVSIAVLLLAVYSFISGSIALLTGHTYINVYPSWLYVAGGIVAGIPTFIYTLNLLKNDKNISDS